MSYQPVVPLSGFGGWAFLNRTLDAQTEAFRAAPLNARDMEYFRENIGNVNTAEDLVSDFQLLRVSLGAFGLQDDLPNRAFIRTVLADGTSADDALSNRLADKRYRTFSEAFGFGVTGTPPRTQSPGFADEVLAKFQRVEFERAVGEQNNEMRLALNLQRELPEIAAEDVTTRTSWLRILGNPPLREVFETALGIPSSFGTADLNRQVEAFQDRAQSIFGTDDIKELASDEGIDNVVRNYLGRAQIAAVTQIASPAAIALTLLQPLAR